MTERTYRTILIVVAVLCFGAACGPGAGDEEPRGEAVYRQNCERCHRPDGEGSPVYPALAGNETVTGDPEAVIETVLSGPSAMPTFRDQLSDEEIAAVVSYIRNTWGNDAPTISADDVAAVR